MPKLLQAKFNQKILGQTQSFVIDGQKRRPQQATRSSCQRHHQIHDPSRRVFPPETHSCAKCPLDRTIRLETKKDREIVQWSASLSEEAADYS